MSEIFRGVLGGLVDKAEALAESVIAPLADAIDAEGRWPEEAMHALGSEGLLGLTAPTAVGGQGEGLLGIAAITEVVGRHCASTAMCFGMHCVATAVMAAKATRRQEEEFLEPIARGDHVTTLALSEPGTGSFFFLPRTTLERRDDGFVLTGCKHFVTNGGYADSYVVSTGCSEVGSQGEFSCLVVPHDAHGILWGEPWRGLGMHGNSSRAMTLDRVVVPSSNLLGEDGDQVWFVFEVVAPYFLTAMAGTYVGVAAAALTIAMQHLKARRYEHSGQTLAETELLQHRIGQLWTGVEKSRLLLHHAARLGDLGSADALTAILAAKADAANTAVTTTNEALTLCGGIAYRENSVLARLLRDARASHVMSPTTDILTVWTGRSALGLPLI